MSLNHTWLPAAKPDFSDDSLEIDSAKGSFLITSDGEEIYDAISSWWCKPLGHCHPTVRDALINQLQFFEHHIPANAYNKNLELLSQKLTNIFITMDKVMYASDGSSAVEIALKLSYETRVLNNQPQRKKFIALIGSYHGETMFTLSLCGISAYTKNYQELLANNYFIEDIPYVTGRNDPLWHDCKFDEKYWQEFFVTKVADSSGLVFEPIVQGAAGIRIISRDFLIRITNLARAFDLHIIADEIMVGLGRLGYLSVVKDLLGIEPDLVCFAKNLTAGSIPMSAVVINKSISHSFRTHNKIFPHSHTHSCNALATSVALSYLDWLTPARLNHIQSLEPQLINMLNLLHHEFTFISNCRVIGTIAACDLLLPESVISKVFTYGITEKIYLRPINNTLYIMPPLYNLENEIAIIYARLQAVLQRLKEAITD